jgi:FtsP/CotA-like multicopper oxidase with cupredoxin domain
MTETSGRGTGRHAVSRRTIVKALGAGIAAPLALPFPQALATTAGTSAPNPEGAPTALLEAKPGFAEFQPGVATNVWGFGGKAPGPDLRVRRGEDFRARLVNGITQPLSLHWHGVRLANDMDGVAGLTQEAAAAGGAFDIRFAPPDAGTFIYRPMAIGSAAQAAERGLTGVLVVEDPGAPEVDVDRVLAVDDWRLGEDGQIDEFNRAEERTGAGRLGNLLTVNGTRAPFRITAPPGSRVRLRLANLCNARILRLRLDGLKAYVVAVDGQPTDTFEPLKATLPFGPGTRYDLISDLPTEAGVTGTITAMLGGGLPIAQVVTEGEPVTTRRQPLAPLAPLTENSLLPGAIPLEKSQRADIIFDGGAKPPAGGGPPVWSGDPNRIWTVNGVSGPTAADKSPDFGKPVLSVKRGTPVVFTLANRTSFTQVIHLHGHCFRLLHPLDDGWEPYWLDTVILNEKQTSRIAFIADNKGKWLIGSGVLERLDTGLSTWFEVT